MTRLDPCPLPHPKQSFLVVVVYHSHLTECSFCLEPLHSGEDRDTDNRRECHEPTNHVGPCGILVGLVIRQRFVCDQTEQESSLGRQSATFRLRSNKLRVALVAGGHNPPHPPASLFLTRSH